MESPCILYHKISLPDLPFGFFLYNKWSSISILGSSVTVLATYQTKKEPLISNLSEAQKDRNFPLETEGNLPCGLCANHIISVRRAPLMSAENWRSVLSTELAPSQHTQCIRCQKYSDNEYRRDRCFSYFTKKN